MGAALLLWGLLALLTPGICGQCLSPPRLNFARPKYNSKSVFDIGYALTFECLPGYMSKIFKITCLKNSTWSSVDDNICKRRSCRTPAELLNGKVQITNAQFGSTIKYSCDDGYQLIGHSSNQCIISENTVIWENEAPLCEVIRCELPPAIPNGRYKSTNEYFHYDMVVSYECNTGPKGEKLYDLVGNKTLYCTSKDNKVGIWNSPPPQCITPVKCQTPLIANGRNVRNWRHTFTLNDAVELECNPGFTMKGSKVVQCQSNSQWKPALPVCFKGCLPPEKISHGNISSTKDSFSFGDIVSYVCEPGYFLNGTALIKCIEPGKWNSKTPKCEVKSCENLLDQLPNGHIISPGPPSLGSKVSFVCDEGFWLNGSSSSTCVLSGMTVLWNNKIPVCERILCDSPLPISNGRLPVLPVLPGNKVPYGTTIRYSCFKSFRMIGTRNTICTSKNQVSGVWSEPAPRCETYSKTTLCPEPKVLDRHLKLRSRPPYRHGDTVIFACDTNFTLKGYSTLWCQANNRWAPSSMPTCESDFSLECPSPPTIPNGQPRNGHSGPVAPGLSVTYSCEPGYILVGERTIWCLSSGVWNTTAPKCKEALCDPLIKFPNGQVEEPSHLQIGAVMTFSCNKGYHLQGQTSSQCVLAKEGVVWTKIPICIEVFCPPPPVIENGKYTGGSTGDVPFGTRVIYECNADPERGRTFNLIGERILQCISNQGGTGKWSAAAPRCELSASSLQCLPPTVPNGHKISEQGAPYLLNDTVVFHCDAGFSLRGSSQIRCSTSGTWDPEVPICEKACQPPPEIPHGHHTGRNVGLLDPGTSVNYSCDLGYSLIGEETIHCTAGGVWKPFVPLCKAILCPPPPVIENGKYTGGSTGDVPFGTRVIYECNADPERGRTFNLIGERILQCISNQGDTGKWSAAAPRCELSASSLQCLPPTVPNGHKISEQGAPYLLNDIVVFHCDAGFSLRGSSQIRCSASGTWDPEVPTCEKACQPPPEIPHGHHTGRNVGLLDPGTSVNYSCDLGYSLIGEETIHCTAGGVWKPFVPLCKAILCPPPPVIENGKYTGGSTGDVPFGTRVIYECNADPERGRKFNLIGERTLQCISNQGGTGKWSAAAPRCELSASSLQCLPPTVPNGHKISEQGAPYLLNDTVVFHCDAGFSLRGSSQIRCSASGTWDPEVPTCEKACQPPPEILHGHHTGRNVGLLDPGTSVNYSCDLGYSLIGEETIHCTAGGVWKPFVPLCKAILCPPPPVIENGKYTGGSTGDVPFGTRVIYECNADPERGRTFNLIGERILQCISNQGGTGKWSAAAPRCELSASSLQCLPPTVPNGHKISEQGAPYLLNDTVVFHCDAGFSLRGSSQIRCSASGTWDPEVPTCEKACQPPPEIPHGHHTGRNVGLLDPGTSVNYSCDLGYSLIGEETIHCTAGGVWKPFVPLCKAILCPPPPVIENGKYTGGSTGDVPFGTRVIYECNADPERGRTFNLIGERILQCISNQGDTGKWSAAAPRCELSASSLQCLPPTVPNGHKISEQGAPYLLNDTVVFHCDAGFSLRGSSQIRCSASGTWDPEVPICEKACQPPPEIPHGHHTGRNVGLLDPGTSVNYSCDLGYSLIGEETIHCTAGGVWKPFVPLCKAILCPPPPVIENGKYTGGSTGDVPFGTRVIYECNADPERGRKFNLIGERTLQCISNQGGTGKWSAAAPRCELSASSLQCLPPTVPNGHKISEQGAPYLLNDTVVFHCDAGFSLRGSSQIRCSASGTWDPEVPTCEKACQPPPEIPHGHHTGRNVGLLDPGTSVNYSCDLGYSLIGEETIHCTAGGVWKPFVPLCKAILCPPPPVIENGKYTGGSTGHVPFGTRVIYECNADPERGRTFNLIGERILQCISNQGGTGKWSAAAPRCELSASSLQCLPPTVPNGHKISEQGAPYLLNDTVVFHCDAGFSLRGSSQIRCSASGTWDPEVPTCEKEASCEPIEEQLQLPSDGSPVVPVNSSCHEGYQLTGHVYKLCRNPEAGNRFWFQKIPLCKEVNCHLPEFIIGAHNVSTKKIYDFGAIFTLKCDEGYMLEGSPQSQCQEDHRWDPPLAVCKSLNYSSLLGSQGPLVLGGISLGTVLLILFAGIVLAIISKYKEGNYYTNENCKEVAIHLEAQADYNNDTYSFAT
ncbi:complement receptor type 1-like isoform 3-T3 [Sarcophilus harrisii]